MNGAVDVEMVCCQRFNECLFTADLSCDLFKTSQVILTDQTRVPRKEEV